MPGDWEYFIKTTNFSNNEKEEEIKNISTTVQYLGTLSSKNLVVFE